MALEGRYFKSEIPEGSSGEWVVERVTVADRDYDPRQDPRPDPFKLRPGRYTCLRRGQTQFMTDLCDEWWTQRAAIVEACRRGGQVLLTGLGLGLVAESMLRAPDSRVERVTAVEMSDDVIRLVAPHLEFTFGKRLEIVHADAFDWFPAPGVHFTVGWHDIWPNPHETDRHHEMNLLERRFASHCDWQGSWVREYLKTESARAP